MALTVFDGLDQVEAAVGHDLGTTEWLVVDAARVAAFGAAVGGDHRRDHVPELLVLSLSNYFLPQLVEVRGVAMGVNYGAASVRFPAALPVGSSVRASAALTAADRVPGGLQTTIAIVVVAAGEIAVCEVESLSRWMA